MTSHFSVVIAAHDAEATIAGTIGSVLAQTEPDFEVLVVDDGSSDGTSSAAEGAADDRVRILRQPWKGVSAARNAGLAAAVGRYITFLDADDVAYPHWLETFRRQFAAEPEPALVFGGVRVVEAETGRVLREHRPEPGGSLFHDEPVLFLAGSFAASREILKSVGGYAEELGHSENTELGIRLMDRCLRNELPVRSTDRSGIEYRIRRFPPIAAVRSREQRRLDAVELILHRHRERFERDPDLFDRYLRIGAVAALRAGRPGTCRALFRRAAARRPWRPGNHLRHLLAWIPGLRWQVWRPR